MVTEIKSLDSKVSVSMFLKSMQGRFKKLLASTMTPEEKLAAITSEMTKDVQVKRELARTIGAQKKAMRDPNTSELEAIERLEARRATLVQLGGRNINDPVKLGAIQQEIKGLDVAISAQQVTYDTLEESYNIAMANYKQAFVALESARTNGPAILNAIRAHKDALALRDRAKNQDKVDAKFMDDLTAELSGIKAEMRSDKEIDADLDATNPFNIDKELSKMDATVVDEKLMAEFQAVANKKS